MGGVLELRKMLGGKEGYCVVSWCRCGDVVIDVDVDVLFSSLAFVEE